MMFSSFSLWQRWFASSLFLVAGCVHAADGVPWGVSSSASGWKNHAAWFPEMAKAGVATVRLFPEWPNFESEPGKWDWKATDAMLEEAQKHQLEINAILMGAAPGSGEKGHTFPMKHLPGWENYVSQVVAHYQDRVKFWEVWNEGNGGFNDGRHTTKDYAQLALSAYRSAKKSSKQAQVGLSVASYDAPYLLRSMEAMAEAGEPGTFDFLAIHPYELADGLSQPYGEIPFLWMSQLLRDGMRKSAPDKASVPIWITEIGRKLDTKKQITEANAASALVKIYTLALAQGIAKIQWFEARDPEGEEAGFGLLAKDGTARPAYHALKSMTQALGPNPRYVGWLALGKSGQGFGFVFQGASEPILIAWMPEGVAEETITLTSGSKIVKTEPAIFQGLPETMAKKAAANRDLAFPWGGSFAKASAVHVQLGTAEPTHHGVYAIEASQRPRVQYPDGSSGVILQANQSSNFFTHPSFATLAQREYYIRITVRRLVPGNLGMNLFYELADSRGQTPYKNREQWFSVGNDDGWQTHTWHVTDASFAKLWGFDFSIRPEQSVPFVLGKVEVQTTPF